jgi:hypothetical protein
MKRDQIHHVEQEKPHTKNYVSYIPFISSSRRAPNQCIMVDIRTGLPVGGRLTGRDQEGTFEVMGTYLD